MMLLQLSTEILFQIFDHIGANFFREDLRRLTVSNYWYAFAWAITVRDMQVSTRSFRRFITASMKGDMLDSTQRIVRDFRLLLTGFEGWETLLEYGWPASPSQINVAMVNEWVSQFNKSLSEVACIANKCNRMRSLSIHVHPNPAWPRRESYISITPLYKLLSMKHLTSLEFDETGYRALDRSSDSPDFHLCHAINMLLPTLRRLRCRMWNICEALLRLPPGETTLKMADIIISLTLLDINFNVVSCQYPIRCRHIDGKPIFQLRADIERQMNELIPRLNKPQTARVLSHAIVSNKIVVYDALTRKRMQLASCDPWDSDGEVQAEENALRDIAEMEAGNAGTPA
jgi:hypothetical protein